jgi:hypothetical protein
MNINNTRTSFITQQTNLFKNQESQVRSQNLEKSGAGLVTALLVTGTMAFSGQSADFLTAAKEIGNITSVEKTISIEKSGITTPKGPSFSDSLKNYELGSTAKNLLNAVSSAKI